MFTTKPTIIQQREIMHIHLGRISDFKTQRLIWRPIMDFKTVVKTSLKKYMTFSERASMPNLTIMDLISEEVSK
jgi:hypothetical protein